MKKSKEADTDFYEVCMKNGRAVSCGHKMTEAEARKWFTDLEEWIKNGRKRH